MALPAQRKKVSPDTWIKLGVFVAGGVAVAFGVKKVLDYFKPERKRDESENKQVVTELDAEKKKNPASYPISTYAGWASAIAQAIFGGGTDFRSIYDIFNRLKNNTDYLYLQKAWGNPKRQVYPDWFIFYDTGRKFTLPEALRDDCTSEQVKKLNAVLQRKGIKYRI
jgi:hypothetical protein